MEDNVLSRSGQCWSTGWRAWCQKTLAAMASGAKGRERGGESRGRRESLSRSEPVNLSQLWFLGLDTSGMWLSDSGGETNRLGLEISGRSCAVWPGSSSLIISSQCGLQVTVRKKFGFPYFCTKAMASMYRRFISLPQLQQLHLFLQVQVVC